MDTEALEWAVMTWNVKGGERPDTGAIADVIGAESPDAVALQEIRRSQAADVAQRLGMRFTWARKHYPYTPLLWWRAEGMALMTPHALDAAGHTVISDETSSWKWKRRVAQWALVGREDTSAYRLYNLHLSPENLRAERRAEAVRVARIVEEHGESPPAIVAGDFNDSHDASIIYALPGIEAVPPPPTNPAAAPTQILDHVLVPADASGVSVSVPGGGGAWATLSDHLPVTVRFTMDRVRN